MKCDASYVFLVTRLGTFNTRIYRQPQEPACASERVAAPEDSDTGWTVIRLLGSSLHHAETECLAQRDAQSIVCRCKLAACFSRAEQLPKFQKRPPSGVS